MQQLQQFAIRIQRGDEEIKRLQELCTKNKIDFKSSQPNAIKTETPPPQPNSLKTEIKPPVKPTPK